MSSSFETHVRAPSPVVDRIPRAMRSLGTMPSAVREILKVTERPEVISFAGGLPAEETFPADAIRGAFDDVLTQDGRAALQYGTTEGYLPLRRWMAERMAGQGRVIQPEELLVTSGSQQALDLVGRVMIDPGDTVLVEAPTYLAALQVFRAYEANIVTVDTDVDGVVIGALEEAVVRERPKLIYLVPDHQNPGGTCLSMERRREVLRIAAQYGVAILEDDPYGELTFDSARLPPLFALDEVGSVIYMSTFSKTLAPGLRIGWVSAPPALLRALTVAKQAADLHTSSLNQRATARLLERFDYDGHLARINALYRGRARAMEAAIAEHFPGEASWVSPKGGLFLWVALDVPVSTDRLFQKALEANVAFVPGEPFFLEPPRRPHLRLNFSHRTEDVIVEGVRRLGRVLAELST